MNRISFLLGSAMAVLAVGCVSDSLDNENVDITEKGRTIKVSVSLSEQTKTSLGDKVDGKYPLLWAAGDKIDVVNTGTYASEALTAEYDGTGTAEFTVNNYVDVEGTPDVVVYPSGAIKPLDGTATIPASQKYVKGSFANGSGLMAGVVDKVEEGASLKHLCSYIKIPVSKPAGVSFTSIQLISNASEQISGEMNFEYDPATLSCGLVQKNTGEGTSVTVTGIQWVDNKADIVFAVAPGVYSKGFRIVVEFGDNTVTKNAYSKNGIELLAGQLLPMPEIKSGEFVTINTTEDLDSRSVIPAGGAANLKMGRIKMYNAEGCNYGVYTLPEGAFTAELIDWVDDSGLPEMGGGGEDPSYDLRLLISAGANETEAILDGKAVIYVGDRTSPSKVAVVEFSQAANIASAKTAVVLFKDLYTAGVSSPWSVGDVIDLCDAGTDDKLILTVGAVHSASGYVTGWAESGLTIIKNDEFTISSLSGNLTINEVEIEEFMVPTHLTTTAEGTVSTKYKTAAFGDLTGRSSWLWIGAVKSLPIKSTTGKWGSVEAIRIVYTEN